MKWFSAGQSPALAVLTAVLAFTTALFGHSQTPATAKPADAPSSNAQAAPSATPPPQTARPSGKVIFQRSIDATGNTVGNTGPAAKTAAQLADAPKVDDSERANVRVTALDLDVHLNTADHHIAVRGLLSVRNSGAAPIQRIPLQISSSLNWERIQVQGQVQGKDASVPVATIDSDSDHTGQLHEAVIQLPAPLDPGSTQALEVFYSGAITATARRLLSVGTPDDSASHSDWDVIGPDFTGLRGFGNVVWYPVSSVPVIIGDGARLFDEIGRQKLNAIGTTFRLRLTVEFPHDHAPSIALANSRSLKLELADPQTEDAQVAATATADTGPTRLSFESPALFVASRTAHPGPHLTVYATAEDEVPAKSWTGAAATVAPMLERWLGTESRTQLTVLDLPDPDDAPWESGPLLVIPVGDGPPEQIQSVLSHAMTHAWMAPQPYWLNEGAANFMGAIWYDHQRLREKALATLDGGRQALALAEPSSPGEAQGQPLLRATSPVYYRTKAAYVLWMLRDIVGDEALATALRASNTAAEKNNGGAADPFRAALSAAAPARDLKWLFADWVDADHGLPDFTIDAVFPNAVQSGHWLVSVTISNAGYAAAEVPVTVRSATSATTERVFVPARGRVTPRLLVEGKPVEAQVNDGSVPETQATVHITKLDQTPEPQNPSN